MSNNIHIQALNNLNDKQVNQLVSILNTDDILNKSLGSQSQNLTPQQFKIQNNDWDKKHQAKLFAIMHENQAIGMISLSHIDLKNKKANIGYWLASKYWGKGITTEAFKQILAVAKKDKIKFLSCTIDEDNKASIGIWQVFQAKITRQNGKIVPIIEL